MTVKGASGEYVGVSWAPLDVEAPRVLRLQLVQYLYGEKWVNLDVCFGTNFNFFMGVVCKTKNSKICGSKGIVMNGWREVSGMWCLKRGQLCKIYLKVPSEVASCQNHPLACSKLHRVCLFFLHFGAQHTCAREMVSCKI